MKELLGEEITGILTDDERGYLVFTMFGFYKTPYFIYSANGDCCSTTWFESISNTEYLIGHTIIGIEIKKEFSKEYIEKINADEDDCIAVYGYTLKTEAGYSDIEFRNSSNGYYGGWCEYKPDLTIEKCVDYVSLKIDNKEIAQLKPWKNKE